MAKGIGFVNQASRGNRKNRTGLRILLILASALALIVGCVVLYCNNVIFTTGPSQKNVQREASRAMGEITANLPGSPMLGAETPYYKTCGPGELPINYASAGMSVRFTGVPEALHDSFSKAVEEKFHKTAEEKAVDTTKTKTWEALVSWDSIL